MRIMFTRQDYMNTKGTPEERAAAHRRYYAQFVNASIIAQVVRFIGADAIRNSKDPHFNDIALVNWDRLCGLKKWQSTQQPLRPLFGPLPITFNELGDFCTLAGLVCIAKEAARQWLEQQPKGE
jgi:hypothetical protein